MGEGTAMLSTPAEALACADRLLRERFGACRIEGDSTFFSYREDAIPLSGYIQFSGSLRAVLLRISPVVPIGVDDREKAALYLVRVNHALPVGSWSLNLDDGDLRWKSGFFFGESGVSREMLEDLVESSVELVRNALPGWVRIIAGAALQDALRAQGGSG